MISGDTDVTDLELTLLPSAHLISSSKVDVWFWMKDVDHTRVFALKGKWLKNKMVGFDLREID